MAGDVAGTNAPRPALTRRHTVGATSARSLLLTVLGELVLPSDRPAWTAALLSVLSGLGVEEKASRQALARTAADGLIAAERDGRRVRWSLTDPGRHLLRDGARRIYTFAEPQPAWDGRWLVLSVTVAEGQRRLRERLRTRMAWAGFGSPAANLWVSPNPHREAEAKQILGDLGLLGSALSFTGPLGAIGTEQTIVDEAWNLRGLAAEYATFLAEFAGRRPAPGDETLRTQVLLVHRWRRFPFVDPQLPRELLPPDWIGHRAGAVFRELRGRWNGEAQRRWYAVSAGQACAPAVLDGSPAGV
jgi:phenylacetic acid degradation operon negative regulatory protein